MGQQVSVIAWDYDGVLNRNTIGRHFIWVDDFERDLGHPPGPFIETVFGGDLEALLTGRVDLRDKVQTWVEQVGYAHDADHLLNYWFNADVRPCPVMHDHVDRLSSHGIRQVMVTNNEARRAAFIEHELGFGDRLEHIFAAGKLGLAKPDARFYEAVSETLNVNPDEILIVDDFEENVEAAIDCGWQGIHFTPEVREVIGELLPRPRAVT